MAILRELEVDLVLSGHRHVPYVWSISGVRVVHSGTVSTLRVRGTMPPSYNVIEIDEDEVSIALRQPGQGRKAEPWHVVRQPVTTSSSIPSASASCARRIRGLRRPRRVHKRALCRA